MKKSILAAGISLLLVFPGVAAEPTTLNGRMERVEDVLYGGERSGSLTQRITDADNLIYGTGSTTGMGLDDKIGNLYADVVNSGNDAAPSISARTNALEYYLTDEIKKDSLPNRIGDMEKTIFGNAKSGALDKRAAELEKAVYGDQHAEMKDVVLPQKTVFKISLNDSVSSKTNLEGDPVEFTVQDDVKVGDALVLPRGSRGSGVVTKVSRPKSFGRSGKLDISFDQVFSLDDEPIPTVLGPEAKEKLKMEAAAVGASAIGALALGPVGLVGGLFVKGKDVELPAGSELYIQTQSDVLTKGLVTASGAPNMVLRDRVSKSAVEKDVKVTVSADAAADAASKNTVENVRNELKFVNEDGKEIDPATKMVKSSEETIKENAAETIEAVQKTVDEGEETASVVIVRNE